MYKEFEWNIDDDQKQIKFKLKITLQIKNLVRQ